MKTIRPIALSLAILLSPALASATELNCGGPSNTEEFRYSWHIRGGLRWLAGIIFPTSGVGNLKVVYPKDTTHTINSELLLTPTSGQSGGFFAYESDMDWGGKKTLVTYNGYQWGNKSRKERTAFDYVKRLAHVHKETPGKVEEKDKPIEETQLRDTLTLIHFLRQNASHIIGPMTTSIYEGKEYPVVIQPAAGRPQQFTIEGKTVNSVAFEIIDAPGGRRWPGHVKVWLSQDERRIPFRIELQQSMASVQLDLDSIESCAFMQAAK